MVDSWLFLFFLYIIISCFFPFILINFQICLGYLILKEDGDVMVDHYWCHMCSRMVTPVMEAEIKCPSCESGFVEEIGSTRDLNNNGIDFGGEHAFSTWHCLV